MNNGLRRAALFGIGFAIAGCAEPQVTPPLLVTQSAQPQPSVPPLTSVQLASIKYRAADCHLHLVDFLQRTDGIRAAMAAMDKCGVEDAVVSGMPVVKQWPEDDRTRPEYYL